MTDSDIWEQLIDWAARHRGLHWHDELHGDDEARNMTSSGWIDEGVLESVSASQRQTILSVAPQGLQGDELERWWIVFLVSTRQQVSKFVPNADPGNMVRVLRQLPAERHQAITECKAAIATLRKHLAPPYEAPNFDLGPPLWRVPEQAAIDADKALTFFSKFIDHLEKRALAPDSKAGNTPSARGVYTRVFWPTLKDQGYSMRAAARLMAEAFIEAGLEKEDMSESIYQAIRNATR